jgi:hypothetical protein
MAAILLHSYSGLAHRESHPALDDLRRGARTRQLRDLVLFPLALADREVFPCAVWLKRRRRQTALFVLVLAAIAAAISYVEYRPPVATPPGVIEVR